MHVFQGQNPGPQSMMHGMGQQGPNGKGNVQPFVGRKVTHIRDARFWIN